MKGTLRKLCMASALLAACSAMADNYYITGGGIAGVTDWAPAEAGALTDEGNGIFTWTFTNFQGDFKLSNRLGVDNDDWAPFNDGLAPESGKYQLLNNNSFRYKLGGAARNYTIPTAGDYKLTVDTNNGTIYLEQLGEHKYYVNGAISPAGWCTSGLAEFTNEGDGVYTFKFEGSGGFRIPNTLTANPDDWDPLSVGVVPVDGNYNLSEGDEVDVKRPSYDEALQNWPGDWNITSPGKYTLTYNEKTNKLKLEGQKVYKTPYIQGDAAFGGWTPVNAIAMTQVEEGIYTYSFEGSGSFRISLTLGENGDDWNGFNAGGVIPASTSYYLGYTSDFAYTTGYPATDYHIYQPGKYTITVNEKDETIKVEGTPEDTVMHTWHFAGEQTGWDENKIPLETKCENGVYTMTATFDNLGTGEFKLHNGDWQHQFSSTEEINDYGTYNFSYYRSDMNPANAKVTTELPNVKMEAVWDHKNPENVLVTLSKDTTTRVDMVEETKEAKYFTLTGIEVSEKNLAPGIYICRKGNTSAKVYIK